MTAIDLAMAISKFFESSHLLRRISSKKSAHATDDYNLTYFESAGANIRQKRIDSFDPSDRC